MIKVKEYIKNVGKSTVYAASDVLGEHYSTLRDFKNTNQEVFKESYTAIKDYRTTFSRVKTQIQKSDVYTAGSLGIQNLISDLKSGTFYNKEREAEYTTKYGGDLTSDSEWDMDESDFNWDDKTDVSDGEKIIATAIKKNNKMSTVMMADAMAQGHKGIIDSSRENTTLLYVQQEKMFNKIGGGLDNITSLLRGNMENTAKVQNRQMENTNKFYTNMEKKTDTIVAQLDEMIKMQRNLYQNEMNKEKERKRNTVTDISSGGIPDLKEYGKLVKGNIKDAIGQMTWGASSMGDALGGANIFAMFTSNPLGALMKMGVNKAIGTDFKKASKDFDKSLKGLFSTLMSKANSAKNSNDPIAKALGTIFGIKVDKESDTLRTDKYTRGPIPFDGVTKKAITEVMPFYLRKMTSILTGEDEQVFDYKTGKWTTVKAVQKRHNDWKNAGSNQAISELSQLIAESLGKDTGHLMNNFRDQKRFKENYQKLTDSLYKSNGDLNVLNKGMESGIDQEFLDTIKVILQDNQYYYTDKTRKGAKGRTYSKTVVDRSKGANGVKTGLNSRSVLSNLARNIFETKASRADQMRNMETESDLIERILYSEGIIMDPDSKNNPSIRNKHGDFNTKTAFKSPLAQAMIYMKDDNGYTLFNYLQYIKRDLTAIRASGLNLLGQEVDNNIIKSNVMDFEKKDSQKLFDITKGGSNYKDYEKQERRNEDNYNSRYQRDLDRYNSGSSKKKPIEVNEFKDIIHYLTEQQIESENDNKKKLKNKKDLFDIAVEFNLMSKEEANKFKSIEYTKDKSMKENMSERKGFEKVVLLQNYANKLIQKPWEAVTDAVINVDKWMSDFLFGKALAKNKEDKDAEDKGLLMTFRDKIVNTFEDISDKVGDKIGKFFEDKVQPFFKKHLDPITKFLFGEKADSESERKGGLFGGFIGKVETAFKNNGIQVKEYIKKTAKNTKKQVLGESEEKITESSFDGTDTVKREKMLLLRYLKSNNDGTFKKIEDIKKYIDWCYSKGYNNSQIRNGEGLSRYLLLNGSKDYTSFNDYQLEKNTKINPTSISQVKKYIINNGSDKFFDNEDEFEAYLSWVEVRYKNGNYRDAIKDSTISKYIKDQETKKKWQSPEYVNKINARRATRGEAPIEASKSQEPTEENTNAITKLTSPIEKIAGLLEKIVDKITNLPNIGKDTGIATTAKGGINKSGKAFHSVVSSGEIVNGNIVPPGGPYLTTIPKGGYVINPASGSTINKQAAQERGFINKLKSNAKADDGLSKATVVKYMEDEENQKFAADVVAKGGIGLGAGLLLGHPLLAAGIGIASGFANKSNGFANAIFGEATGKVGEDGKLERKDNGLISKEIQKAIPDVKKFGLGGAIAGLITPFGPLGGLMIGSAIGFAKNNSMIQDTLFGENGLIGKDKKDKLKKALPAMGIGAASAALLGPFGLIGNAVLGATAGYVTSMDKFKNAIFGEEKDVDTGKKDKDGNPIMDKKRQGGLLGAIKNGMEPLKDFGRTIVDGITDAVFGKKKGKDGKREGGLFGMAKDQIIAPIADGLKPIIQEAKNMFKKTVNSLTGMVKKHMENNVGSHTMDKLGNLGGKLGKAGIKIGKGALWLKAAPLMLGAKAVKGVGAGLRRKQIRRGEADDMTASERLAYRKQSLLMSGGDKFSEYDENLMNWAHDNSVESMEEIQNALLMSAEGENAINTKDAMLRKEFDKEISEYLKGTDAGKIMSHIKGDSTNYKKAEKLIRAGDLKDHKGNVIKDSEREKLLASLNTLKKDRGSIESNFENLKSTKKKTNKKLKDLGIDLNTLDNKTAKKYAAYLNTEIVHKKAGLTPEEDPHSPLNQNTTELSKVKEALADLIKCLTGQKEAVAEKYAEEEKKNEEESDEEVNDTETKTESKVDNTLKTKLKTTKQFTPRQRMLMDSLVSEASDMWNNALIKAMESGPNDNGEYVFVVNNNEYRYSNNKEYDKEYDRCIDDYIRDKAPGLLKLKDLKKESVGKSSKMVKKLKTLGLGKLALILAMGPVGVGAAALGYGAFKFAKWGAPKLAKGAVGVVKGIGKGTVNLVAGKKTVVGQDEDGNDIVRRKGGMFGGVRNAISGAVENVTKKGKDAKLGDKILAKLDDLPHKIGKTLVGDKNKSGLLSKIFGVAKVAVGVPLMVGFLKETIFPFLKNKVGPLFLGTKNQDGEYEGGLISGIVNPLKKAFKTPFQKVRDWFKGEGEFSGGNSGMPGMIKNFKSIADYFISLWKSGAETIFSKWIPEAVGGIVRNLPKAIGKVLENIWPMLKNIWNSKDETKVGSSGKNLTEEIKNVKNGNSGNQSNGIPFYTTFGQIVNITPEGATESSGDPMANINKIGNINLSIPIQPVKELNNDSVVEGGTASSGDKIYYAKDDKDKTTPLRMDPETGEFYKASDLSQAADNSLMTNKVYQSMINNDVDGEAVNVNNTLGQRFVKNAAAGLFSPMYRTGRKISGKMFAGAGKVMKHIPFMGTAGRLVEGSGNLMANANISKQGLNSLKDGVLSFKDNAAKKLDNAKFIKEWMTDSTLSMKDKIGGVLDWNGGVTKIKNAPEKALEGMKSKVSKVAESGTKLASEVSEKGLKTTVKDKAKDAAKKAVDKVGDTKGGGVIKKIIGFLKKILNKILTCGPVKKLLAKMGKEGISEAAEKALKEGVEKVAKEAGESLAKKGIKAIATLPAKLAAKVSPAGIAFVVADFVTGMGDARNILKITSEEIEVSDKIIAGFSKVLSGLLFILPESTCCSLILNTIGKALFKDKVEEIQKEQKDSEEALKAYNEENGEDLSIEEYNNKFNATWYTKTKTAVSKVTKKAWGGIKKLGKGIWDNSPIGFAANTIKGIKDKGLIKGVGSAIGKTTVGKAGKAVAKGAKWLWGKIKGNAEADDGLEPIDEDTVEALSNNVSGTDIDNTAPLITIIGLLKNILDKLPNISGIGKMVGGALSKKKGLIGKVAGKMLKRNANADDGLTSVDPTSLGMDSTIDESIDTATSGFEKMQTFLSRFNSQNKASNDMINNGKVDPADKNFWKIKFTKTGNPMIDSMFKMQEYMSRLIKAPFSMVSKTMGNVNNIIGTNDYTGTTGSTSTSGTTQAQDTSEKKESIWTKIKNKFKGIFGKGDDNTGTGGVTDPNHIYQRDYNGSYQTSGDSERQTLADSGCGPAAAATVANRYGLKDNLNNAANYATSNGYKEVNGGTYPSYFSDYLSKKGIKTNTTQSNEEVVKSLVRGKPVIMMGQDKSNSGKSPYGSKYSHYVVATGIDKSGNVIVEDSEDRRSQTKYNLLDTLKNTSVKITTSGNGRYGRGQSGISVLSEYSNALVKGIYGPYYSALFGDNDGVTTNNNGPNGNTSGTNGNSGSDPAGISSIEDSADVETRKKTIWNFLTSKGCSKNLAAAIMGNMKRESEFDPTAGEIASGDGGAKSILNMTHPQFGDPYGCGWGLCQWSYAPGHAALYNWCTAHNLSADTLEGQLNYLMAGLTGNDVEDAVNSSNSSKFGGVDGNGVLSYTYNCVVNYGGLSALNKLSIDEAVAAFYDLYERGADRSSDLAKSIPWAKEIYDQFANESGSGKGKESIGNRSYRRGSSGKGRTYSAKSLYSNKYGRSNLKSYYGRADEEVSEEETPSTESETTPVENTPSQPSSALEAIGTYTGRLMKSIYGDYWKALFGSDEDTDLNDQEEAKRNTTSAGSGMSTIYNASLVFSEMSKVSDGTYNQGSRKTITINGTTIQVREDCSGYMGAILNAMGYNMPDIDSNGTSPGAGDFGKEGCSSKITKLDGGSCSGDWIDIPFDVRNLQPGDIISCDDHVEMWIYWDNSQYYHGYNAGATLAIQRGFKVANAVLDAVNKNPDKSIINDNNAMGEIFIEQDNNIPKTDNDGLACANITYSSNYIRIVRFVGQSSNNSENASGRGKLKNKQFGRSNSINNSKNRSRANKNLLSNNKVYQSTRGDKSILTRNNYLSKSQNNNTGRGYFDNVRSGQNNNSPSSQYYNNITPSSSNLNTDQLVSILEIIADNSNKTDQIVQLLAAIVTNTSISNSSSNNTTKINQLINQIKNNTSSAPLSGLNQVLNNNGNNIANAVYSIAKS